MEKQARLAIPSTPRSGSSSRRNITVAGAALSALALTYFQFLPKFSASQEATHSTFEKVQECAIHNLHQDLSFLDVEPIKADEFIERRDRLAQALVASNVDAFVLEPGYTFQ